MPAIILERPYESNNFIKYIDIYIDGKKVGVIESDQTMYIELSAKKHTLMVKKKWLRGSNTLEIDLSNNRDVAVTMKTRKFIDWLPVVIPTLLSYAFWKISWHYSFYPNWAVSTLVIIGFVMISSVIYGRIPQFKLNVRNYALRSASSLQKKRNAVGL